MTGYAALRSPAFRRYLTGQVPSVTCTWIQVVALSWTVVDRDPTALGWVVALQFAPTLLLGPWFGAVTDRHDRRRILMLAEAGLGLVAAAYAVAAATDRLTLPLIFGLAAAWGVINALDTPARQALIPALVEREHAAGASALTGIVLLSGMTAGSALGATIVATAGIATAFALNAASFLADVVLLWTIRVDASAGAPRAPRQLREGLAYIGRTPRLRRPLATLALLATCAFTVQVSVPILARSFTAGPPGEATPSIVGIAMTAVTAGGLAGALLAAARGRPGPRTLAGASTAMAVAMAVTAAAPTVPVMLAGLAGIGLTWSLFVTATIAILQTAEPALLGRVMSWLAVVFIGGLAVGGPLAGAVAAAAGAQAPFVLGAATAVIAAAVLGGRTAGRTISADGDPSGTGPGLEAPRYEERNSVV
jgi:MFS family permease